MGARGKASPWGWDCDGGFNVSLWSSELSSSTGGEAPTRARIVLDQSEVPRGASLPIRAVAHMSPTTQ